ncbi:hypothetical protein NX059_008485 [Plenodomus lindquistii]|nr:hypothetical protein NX059_008485 [Plenodomus lindquistii]
MPDSTSAPGGPWVTKPPFPPSNRGVASTATSFDDLGTGTSASSDELNPGKPSSGAAFDQDSLATADETSFAGTAEGTGSTFTTIGIQSSQPRASMTPQFPGPAQSSSLLVTTSQGTAVATPTTEASLQTDRAGSRNHGSSLSSGAVAGIAIAMLIAGAAIALLAAFFVFKRRDRTRSSNVANKDYTTYGDSTPEFVMMQQQKNISMGGRNSPYVQVSQTATPAPAIISTASPASAQHVHDINVAAFLPPATPESKVYNKVMGLFRECHSHIETYYRDVHASITPSMEPGLAQFGSNDVNMAELLQDCSSPTTVLKHAIVAWVLGITRPRSGENGETMFPEELERLHSREAQGDSANPNVTAASVLHRRLSVYLYNAALPVGRSRSLSTQSDAREAAEHFSLTFFPWADPSASDQDRDDALASLIQLALDINVWLYGEPSLYAFEWEETGRRGVLVSPSLIKWTDSAEGSDRKVVVEGVVMAA